MTLSQRLTRAGLTFIILGTVAALVPIDGTANAAIQCASNGQTDTLGINPTDASRSYPFVASSGSLNLTTFVDGIATAETFSFTPVSGPGSFTNAVSGSSVNITASGLASENVTAVFTNGVTITVGVTAT